ncbi:hypothetical protein FBQ96_09180 [Nitrospirales bacterium NOB]|nr:hypothetical protein [Nitrospirales bacterium NOB]
MATFSEDVLINGNLQVHGTDDTTQMEVRGTADQSLPLQTWADSAGEPLAQITGDGRLELGTLDVGTPDALVEANNTITLPSAVPLRGMQSLGHVMVNSPQILGDGIAWSVQELELLGNAVMSGIHTALRGKLTQQNIGDADQAERRAADFEAVNEGGNETQPIGRMVGVQSTVTNEASGHLDEAVGIGITVNDEGVSPVNTVYGLRVDSLPAAANEAYAIHTGDGPVHLGDFVELKRPVAVPSQPATDLIRVYPKSDGKLYAKNWNNQEFDLTGGVGGSPPLAGICDGRLTLSSGTPVPTIDVLAATTLYFTPFQGNQVALFDGAQWALFPFTERSLDLSELAANTLYDIFLYDDAGTLTLEAVAWNVPDNGAVTSISNASPRVVTVPSHTLSTGQLVTVVGNSVASNNATWRVGTTTATTFQLRNLDGSSSSAPGSVGTGGSWQRADQNTSRATALALQDGVYVKAGAPTRRYLGTIRIGTVAGESEDSAAKRYVYNENHPVPRKLKVVETASQWTYSTSAWRAANNDLANRVGVVIGNAGSLVSLNLVARMLGSGAGGTAGIAYDAINTNHGDLFANVVIDSHAPCFLGHYPTAGYHFYQWVENGRGQTCTYFGYSANGFQSGMVGEVML